MTDTTNQTPSEWQSQPPAADATPDAPQEAADAVALSDAAAQDETPSEEAADVAADEDEGESAPKAQLEPDPNDGGDDGTSGTNTSNSPNQPDSGPGLTSTPGQA